MSMKGMKLTMKMILKYLEKLKKECVLAPLFKMLEALFELFVPLVVASIIDRGIASQDTGYIVKSCLMLLLLAVIGLTCSITAQYFSAKAAVGCATGIRHALFKHIQSLSFTELDELGTSTLITRMTSDINQVQNGVNLVLRLFLRSPFIVFGAMIMAFTIDVKAALVFAAAIPVLAVIVFGIMVFLIMLICVASIREINLPPRTNQKTSIIKDIGYLIKNKPYMLMISYTFFLFLGYLGMFAAIAYYFKYIVRNEMMTSVAVTITTIVPIFSMLIAARLNAKYSKRNISIVGTLIQILGSLIIWIGGSNVAIVFLGVGLMGFGMGFRSNMYFSMLADVADYGEWQSGRNLAGTQMAVNGFSNKVSSACASAIVAGLLAWGAYDGTVAVQSSKANMAILFAFVILPIIANIVSIVVMYFYDLDKQYDQMERELKERRKKLAEQTAE